MSFFRRVIKLIKPKSKSVSWIGIILLDDWVFSRLSGLLVSSTMSIHHLLVLLFSVISFILSKYKEHISFYITDRSSTKLKVKKFNILNSPLNKIFDNYENINLSFLGRLNIDTWNNSKSLEMMLDDIIYADDA